MDRAEVAKRAADLRCTIEACRQEVRELEGSLENLQALCGDDGHPGSENVPVLIGAEVGEDGGFVPGTGNARVTVKCPTCLLGCD